MSEPAYKNDPYNNSNSEAAKHYKIRLASGRVIGPLDIDRIRLFIAKNKISGSEVARIYPSGSWKDINQFPEIAELILSHLEGNLHVVAEKSQPNILTRTAVLQEVPADIVLQDEPALKTLQSTLQVQSPNDNEGTMVITPDVEGTLVVEMPVEDLPANIEDQLAAEQSAADEQALLLENDLDLSTPPPEISREKTVILMAPPKLVVEEKPNFIRKIVSSKFFMIIAGLSVAGLLMEEFLPENKKNQPTKQQIELLKFKVALPSIDKSKVDPQKSQIVLKSGLSFYNMDTVDGYKRAAMIFSEAIAYNPNNVSALCLLASSYMNLIDVVNRDEKFFQVITTLISGASAKGIDLPELVIAEVELYNLLSNNEAAKERIVEYSKVKFKQGQSLGSEIFYYMAQSDFLRGDTSETLLYLDKIPVESWFSARIPYLYGLVFEKNGQLDQAVVAFEKVIKRSPNHAKARIHLAEVLVRKDNLPGAGTQADYVIANGQLASQNELARAHYIKARMLGSVNRVQEGLASIEKAKKLLPDDIDILFEYYTIKARIGQTANETKRQIEVYELLAKGEAALKSNNLESAMAFFMAARTRDDNNVQPLLRISEVFRREGDIYSSVLNYGKAIKLAPARADLYVGYIKSLIESYELRTAEEMIQKYIALGAGPAPGTIDYLYGILNLKKENYRVAQAYLKRALQSATVDSAMYLFYADLLFKVENYQDAAFYYGLARRFDPFNVNAATGIAKSLVELQSLEKGVAYLQEQLQRVSHKAPLFVGLAEVYLRKGDLSQAMKAIENAIADDPKFALALKVKGDVLQAQDQLKQAIAAYQSYLSLNPNDPTPRIERYKIAMKQNDIKAAQSELKLVLSNYPSYPGANFMLGDIQLQEQKADEALFYAVEELKRNPDFAQALVLKGSALNLKRDYVGALTELNRALKINPNLVSALVAAGFSNHMLKTYVAAQNLLERAVSIDTGNPVVRKRLGMLYYDMGNGEKARLHLKAYIELFPDAPDRAEIQALVQ